VGLSLPRSPLRGIPASGQTLPALLKRQAEAFGPKPLIRTGNVERSFRDMCTAAAHAAAVLQDAGVEPGERVAMMCGNRIELIDAVLGCAWLGAIAVPLNTALRGRSLEHALGNSGARVIIAEAHLATRLQKLTIPALELVWVLDGPPLEIKGAAVMMAPKLDGHRAIRASEAIGPGTTAAILYTSGTTGPPKGVCCPHAQFYWWGTIMGELLELTEHDVLYTCLPLFHTNALNAFMQALQVGATYVVDDRFSASQFWVRSKACGATVTYLLGAMVNMLWVQPQGPQDRDHRVRIALAPATPTALSVPFRERFGVQLIEAYGSTETNATIGAPAGEQRPGWMGVPLADFEAAIVDEHDAPLPDGKQGELVLRPRHPFSFATGYFGMPEQTVQAWRNQWVHTGDRVVRDPQGWIRFVDRHKDAIRRRGENISSWEVEQAVLEHPDVASVAVFAVPSELAEDEVMAAVVLRDSVAPDPIGLMRHCEMRMPYFAVPRFVDYLEALPMTESGKISKPALRERGVSSSTWDREAAGYQVRR
jgi:carnitine-CoA ligase